MARIRSAHLVGSDEDWIGERAAIKAGYPVLIKFWDCTCINCLRSMEWVDEMRACYGLSGLRVVAVHTPEFSFAADHEYVRWRVKRGRLAAPVLIDSQKRNWEAFANRAWPAYWLVTADGYVEGEWIGEGREREIEEAVRRLLHVGPDQPWAIDRVSLLDAACLPTTEWFGGFRAWENAQIIEAPPVADAATVFVGGEPTESAYSLSGRFLADKESWVAMSANARVRVRPRQTHLGVVAGGGRFAWSVPLQGREEVVIERPQFFDLGRVVPGEIVTLEIEPGKTRLYSIIQSFGGV